MSLLTSPGGAGNTGKTTVVRDIPQIRPTLRTRKPIRINPDEIQAVGKEYVRQLYGLLSSYKK
jgi:hypothetical protein